MFLIILIILISFIYLKKNFVYIESNKKQTSVKIQEINLNDKNENVQNLINEINKIFKDNNKININSIESKYNLPSSDKGEIKNTIHIGFTLDSRYILETMLTMASIMSSQNTTTKIVFHFGVVKDFNAKHMLKMYKLKSKINNLTDYNFYYLKGAMEKMKHFHPKGEACPGKFELPQLLSDDIEKLLIFDGGDLLVFRDLSNLFNYDMGEYWALGVPEPWCIDAFVKKYNISKYLNIGSVLLNVKELKKNNFWDLYTKMRNIQLGGAVDQTLFNIVVPDDKKNYYPIRFGGFSILCTDNETENLNYEDFGYTKFFNSNLSNSWPENPKSFLNMTAQLLNPVYIHVMCGNGKWSLGRGLSIYRHLVKYFIKMAGIWDELCQKKPGYCHEKK